MRKGGKYEALEKSVKDASHEVVRLGTLIDLKRGSIEEEDKRKEQATAAVQETERAKNAKEKEFEKFRVGYEKLRSEFEERQGEAVKKEELLQTLSTGIAVKEGRDNGYMDQLQGFQPFFFMKLTGYQMPDYGLPKRQQNKSKRNSKLRILKHALRKRNHAPRKLQTKTNPSSRH
jgi:chromosome segregation ATPase